MFQYFKETLMMMSTCAIFTAREQHGLSASSNLINMHKIGKIASVGFNSQLLANS